MDNRIRDVKQVHANSNKYDQGNCNGAIAVILAKDIVELCVTKCQMISPANPRSFNISLCRKLNRSIVLVWLRKFNLPISRSFHALHVQNRGW